MLRRSLGCIFFKMLVIRKHKYELPALKTTITEGKTKLMAVLLLASKNFLSGPKNVSLRAFITCSLHNRYLSYRRNLRSPNQ